MLNRGLAPHHAAYLKYQSIEPNTLSTSLFIGEGGSRNQLKFPPIPLKCYAAWETFMLINLKFVTPCSCPWYWYVICVPMRGQIK